MTGAQTGHGDGEPVSVPLRSGGLLIVADGGTSHYAGQPRDRTKQSERYIECGRPVEVRE